MHKDASNPPPSGHSVAPCGLSFTPEEDLMIAQAYCAVLEDSIQGDYQKANNIKEKMQVNYTELCIKYSKINHASLTHSSVNNRRTNKQLKTVPVALYKLGKNMFVLQTAESIWKRFKTKIGRNCMAMSSVVASNPCLSGENEEKYWERSVTEFENREGVKFKCAKLYEYLKDKPKWKVYCDKVSILDTKRKAQPKGANSAKRLESNKANSDQVYLYCCESPETQMLRAKKRGCGWQLLQGPAKLTLPSLHRLADMPWGSFSSRRACSQDCLSSLLLRSNRSVDLKPDRRPPLTYLVKSMSIVCRKFGQDSKISLLFWLLSLPPFETC
jgi:hypothetical protein